MILNVSFDREWHHGENWDEISRIISEVMENLQEEGRVGKWYSPGQDAWFSFSDERHTNESQGPDNFLRVSINKSTGYGALIWGVTESNPNKGSIFDSVWVSDNHEPPGFDPRVVSDPGYPLFHDRCSTLPIPLVRAAVEEFCRSGTGHRPECVDWTPGELNGQRLDRESIVDVVEDDDPFA